MTEDDLVNLIHAIAFGVFWLFLTVGALSVGGRWAFYRAHGFRLPRLLSRDAIFMGGFAMSFGLILVARVLDVPSLRDNVFWALLTDVPAVIAVATFVYFELFVIERGDAGRAEIRDRRGREAMEALGVPPEPEPEEG